MVPLLQLLLLLLLLLRPLWLVLVLVLVLLLSLLLLVLLAKPLRWAPYPACSAVKEPPREARRVPHAQHRPPQAPRPAHSHSPVLASLGGPARD